MWLSYYSCDRLTIYLVIVTVIIYNGMECLKLKFYHFSSVLFLFFFCIWLYLIFPTFIPSFLIISLHLCYISFSCHYHVFSCLCVLLHTLIQGCTNPTCQITVATEFCTLAPTFSVSVLNLLHFILLEPRILRWFLDFRKNVCTATDTDMRRLTTGMRSEQCVVRGFRRCANVIVCIDTT
jgi:hypothetical protein